MTEQEYIHAYETGFKRTLRYIDGLVRSNTLAEDLTQEAWTRMWRYRESFRGDCSIQTYALRICRSVVADYLRSKRNHDQQLPPGYDISFNSPVDKQIFVEDLLSILDEEELYLITEFHINGKSWEEISSCRSFQGKKLKAFHAMEKLREAA